MSFLRSKKALTVIILFILVCGTAYSNTVTTLSYSIGSEFGFGTFDNEESNRITFPVLYARGFIDFDFRDTFIINDTETKSHFSIAMGAGLGLTISESAVPSNIKNHIHPDLFFTFLPGITFDLSEVFHVSVSTGIKYMRLGYRKMGYEESLGPWDTILSFILLGSRPLRVLSVSADVCVRMGSIEDIAIGVGLNTSVPVLQSGNEHFKEKVILEPYVMISF